jgi:hypothetical protein
VRLCWKLYPAIGAKSLRNEVGFFKMLIENHAESIEKQQILNVKKRYRFRKKTLYEREVRKKQKNFLRWLDLPYSYNRWFGNHSFNAALTLFSCYHLRSALVGLYEVSQCVLYPIAAWTACMHHMITHTQLNST